MLLHDASRVKYLKRMRNPRGMGALERGNLHKKIVTECKKSTTCFNEACYAVNGTVKKVLRAKSFVVGSWAVCACLQRVSVFFRDRRVFPGKQGAVHTYGPPPEHTPSRRKQHGVRVQR